MKRLLFLAVTAMVALQGCDKNTEPSQNGVSKQTKEAFATRYPNANNVVWNKKNGYVIATFTSTAVRSVDTDQLNAWFDNQGMWYMTDSDMQFNQLPDAVKSSFASSLYATWRVDEVDKIERNGTETVYVIEVEQSGKEMDLYYSPDGVLIKEMADVDDNYDYEEYIPEGQNPTIGSYIKTKYPNARILEIEREGSFTEVEILDGKLKRELIFENNGNWLRTKTEMRVGDVPSEIKSVLQGSQYASYRIEDVDHHLTPNSEYYRFELESALGDVKVEITADYILTVVGGQSPDDDDEYVGSINQSCMDFIAKHYSGAKIIESEYEKGYLEVEIFHDGREKNVRFNASNNWIDTRWDIRQNELPQAVKLTISSTHASYEIDDAEYIQTASGDYYAIELEKGDHEVTIRIKANGTVV